MTEKRRLDSVGWIFFGMVLLVLLGPCIYIVLENTSPTLTIGMRVSTGVIVAFFGAAFIAWGVNTALQFRAGANEDDEPQPEAEPEAKAELPNEIRGTRPAAKKKKKKKK